jgi:hypothetical protein
LSGDVKGAPGSTTSAAPPDMNDDKNR